MGFKKCHIRWIYNGRVKPLLRRDVHCKRIYYFFNHSFCGGNIHYHNSTDCLPFTKRRNAKASALALYTFFVFLGAASGSLFATHLELFGFKTIMLLISGMLIAVVAFFTLFQKLKTV